MREQFWNRQFQHAISARTNSTRATANNAHAFWAVNRHTGYRRWGGERYIYMPVEDITQILKNDGRTCHRDILSLCTGWRERDS